MRDIQLQPIRDSRLRIGLVTSFVVHGLLVCLTQGSQSLPHAQDRQRGSTTIHLQCVALPRIDAAPETVVLPAEPPPQDDRPLSTPADPAPPSTPASKQILAETVVPEIEAELPVEQSISESIARREPQPREVTPAESVSDSHLSRHRPMEMAPMVVRVETTPAESSQTVVSRPSSGTEVPPSFSLRIDPIYPPELLLSRIEGSVYLLVRVQTDGKPAIVSVYRSSGYRQFDQSARDAVERWTFAPARIGSIPIAKDVIVPVTFRLERG